MHFGHASSCEDCLNPRFKSEIAKTSMAHRVVELGIDHASTYAHIRPPYLLINTVTPLLPGRLSGQITNGYKHTMYSLSRLSSGLTLSACLVYSVQRTVYSVQCTVYGVRYTLYVIRCTVYIVRCTVYGVSVHCTLYGVRCTVYVVY